jgi:hypothetical protein
MVMQYLRGSAAPLGHGRCHQTLRTSRVGRTMEFNRNHFFALGLVLLLAGIQLRNVESFTLNERTSKFLAERMHGGGDADTGVRPLLASIGPTPHHTIHPPEWLGFALMSVGTVLMLHSLAMKKPGG